LYTGYPDKHEGDMAKIKSVLVSEEILARLALQLQIDSMLILGRGEEQTGGRMKKAILADAMEAVIGACYLDQGYGKTFGFLSRVLQPEIAALAARPTVSDYKTLLQEASQKRFHEYPRYKLAQRTGPDHERYYWVDVTVHGTTYGPGAGRNKKSAEQEAARMALEKIGADEGAPSEEKAKRDE
jgi:ribonuclease-3